MLAHVVGKGWRELEHYKRRVNESGFLKLFYLWVDVSLCNTSARFTCSTLEPSSKYPRRRKNRSHRLLISTVSRILLWKGVGGGGAEQRLSPSLHPSQYYPSYPWIFHFSPSWCFLFYAATQCLSIWIEIHLRIVHIVITEQKERVEAGQVVLFAYVGWWYGGRGSDWRFARVTLHPPLLPLLLSVCTCLFQLLLSLSWRVAAVRWVSP